MLRSAAARRAQRAAAVQQRAAGGSSGSRFSVSRVSHMLQLQANNHLSSRGARRTPSHNNTTTHNTLVHWHTVAADCCTGPPPPLRLHQYAAISGMTSSSRGVRCNVLCKSSVMSSRKDQMASARYFFSSCDGVPATACTPQTTERRRRPHHPRCCAATSRLRPPALLPCEQMRTSRRPQPRHSWHARAALRPWGRPARESTP